MEPSKQRFRALRRRGLSIRRVATAPDCSTPSAAALASRAAMPQGQFIVGMTKLAPSLMPEGQREVTVLVLV
jgi:hypothetical protein